MSIANYDTELIHDTLTQAMGLREPSGKSIEIANRILKAGKDALTAARIAKDIRRERFIRVCCVCKRYESGGEWIEGNVPPGRQTHGYCPLCFDEIMKELGK